MKKAQLDYVNIIEKHPVYSVLPGKTLVQKIGFLNQQATISNTSSNTLNISSTLQKLKQLKINLKDELQKIRDAYDEKHAVVLGGTNEYKVKIADLVKLSINTMREKTEMDSNLMDTSFKKLFKNIQKL